MNIDINEINDLNDVINYDTEKNNEESDVKDRNSKDEFNTDNINIEEINDINKQIYSWKTIIEEFKGSSNEKEKNITNDSDNFLGRCLLYTIFIL